jgi:isoamylase
MDHELTEFTSQLIYLRLEHHVFSRLQWFKYKPLNEEGVKDIEWFLPSGDILTVSDWENGKIKSIGVYLSGDGVPDKTKEGKELKDDNFFLFFNASPKTVSFTLPPEAWGTPWKLILDTHSGQFASEHAKTYEAGEKVVAEGRSVMLMMNVRLNKSFNTV